MLSLRLVPGVGKHPKLSGFSHEVKVDPPALRLLPERDFVIDNLLVRIHFIIEMI